MLNIQPENLVSIAVRVNLLIFEKITLFNLYKVTFLKKCFKIFQHNLIFFRIRKKGFSFWLPNQNEDFERLYFSTFILTIKFKFYSIIKLIMLTKFKIQSK